MATITNDTNNLLLHQVIKYAGLLGFSWCSIDQSPSLTVDETDAHVWCFSTIAATAMEHSGEMERSQLYGEVMACTYEDVQVMWSMLDKARICSTAAS
jgi:hypothetical protein